MYIIVCKLQKKINKLKLKLKLRNSKRDTFDYNSVYFYDLDGKIHLEITNYF